MNTELTKQTNVTGINETVKKFKALIKGKEPKDFVNNSKEINSLWHELAMSNLWETDKDTYHKLSSFVYDVEEIERLSKLPAGTMIYPMYYGDIRSTYTGNHAKLKLFYISNGILNNINLRCLGMNEKTHCYHLHGGNYSFTFDRVYALGYLIHNDGYYFKEGTTLE